MDCPAVRLICSRISFGGNNSPFEPTLPLYIFLTRKMLFFLVYEFYRSPSVPNFFVQTLDLDVLHYRKEENNVFSERNDCGATSDLLLIGWISLNENIQILRFCLLGFHWSFLKRSLIIANYWFKKLDAAIIWLNIAIFWHTNTSSGSLLRTPLDCFIAKFSKNLQLFKGRILFPRTHRALLPSFARQRYSVSVARYLVRASIFPACWLGSPAR